MTDDDPKTSGSNQQPAFPRRRVLALATGSLTAGLAGCGSDGDGTPTTRPGTTTAGRTTSTDTTVPGGETGTRTDTPEDPGTPTEDPGTPTEDPGTPTTTPEELLPEDPSPLLAIEGSVVRSGETVDLIGTLANPYVHPVQSVDVSLSPPGAEWDLSATGATDFDSIDTAETREITWEITPPDDADGEYTLEGTVSYETTNDAAEVSITHSVVVTTPDVPGLVASWGFESVSEGTVVDTSGTGNTGTIVGSADVAPGAVGDGLALDGGGQVQVDHDDSLQVQTGDFTLAAWVNPGSTTNQQGVISKKTDDGADDSNLAYQITLGGYPGAGGVSTPLAPTFVYDDGSGLNVSTVDQALSTDQWYHLAVTFEHDTSTVEWYVDGSSATTETLSGTPITNEQELFLGVHWDSGGNPDESLNGVIDEVNIYEERKDPSFVQGLYEAGDPSLE